MVTLMKPDNQIADTIIQGDCLEVLRTLDACSVDAIVTDPPAGIEFMGREWDSFKDDKRSKGWAVAYDGEKNEKVENNGFYTKMRPSFYNQGKKERDNFISFMTEVMTECLRVLKPGGHALIWALPRTSHWTATAIEDAGFEIRDVLTHLFGSGFPKSHNISAAIDKHLGAEREVIGTHEYRSAFNSSGTYQAFAGKTHSAPVSITAPSTPQAQQWQGYGTALKPANEHWILARKPLSEKSIAENCLKWGTGGLNIDACRVASPDGVPEFITGGTLPRTTYEGGAASGGGSKRTGQMSTQGRFPSNLLLSHSLFCTPLGTRKVKGNGTNSPIASIRKNGAMLEGMATHGAVNYNDSEGMEEVQAWECTEDCPIRLLDEQSGIRKSGGMAGKRYEWKQDHGASAPFAREGDLSGRCFADQGGASRYFTQFCYTAKASKRERGENNTHPTVKSLSLMSWLCRLITPPGGTVLDCFAGSGSTCVAAIHERLHFIAIEQDASYCEIARARVAQAFGEVAP